jgi:ribosome-binding protein aMBF1 (putative translation factor)
MGLGEGGRKRAAVVWYLVGLPSYKNLGEAVEGLLARHLAAQRKKETQATPDEQAPVWLPKSAARRSPQLEQLQHARREERLARYEQVIALRKQGLSYQAMASRVGMGASTVQSWLAGETFVFP